MQSSEIIDQQPNRQPHLWVFNQHYPPDALATAAILEAVSTRLVDFGWRVTVITGKPYLLPVHEHWQAQRPELRDGVNVIRVPSWNRRDGTLGRLLHYGVYTLGALAQWLRREPPDICLCLTTPPVLALASGVVGKVLRGMPVVYNTQDLFPDILETSRYAGGMLERFGKLIAKLVESQVDAYVPIGEQMANRLRGRGVADAQLTTIPNPVDTEKIYPLAAEKNTWLKELGLAEQTFRVVYAGNFGHAQGLETVLAAANQLQSETHIQFLLVGAGEGKAEIERHAQSLNNVLVLPFAPALEVLAAGHLGLVPLKAGMGNFLVPSKAVNYLAAGTPILAHGDANSDLGRLIMAHDCGELIAPGDPKIMAEAIRNLANSPEKLAAFAENGRNAMLKNYSGHVIAARYNQLLQTQLCKQHAWQSRR